MKKKSSNLVGKTVYIYQDLDHGDIEVFDTLEKALAHTDEHWGTEHEWEGDIENSDMIHDLYSDYVSIHKKVIL